MPTIFKLEGIRFYFFSNEHIPIHVHAFKAGAEAKIELEPEVRLVYNKGFSPNAIRRILRLAETVEFQETVQNAWEQYFNDKE